MKKAHIIVQARMGSTRVPKKVLAPIGDRPMLHHVIERCRAAQRASRVIVATTLASQDNAIVDFCKINSIDYFRGSEQNVLERYYQTAKRFGSSVIVRVTADCPLIDPDILDVCIEKFYASPKTEYVSNIFVRSFPRGLDTEVFSFGALKKAYNTATARYEKEHVTPFIWENKTGKFTIGDPVLASSKYKRRYRLTVDYPEDLELIRKIYDTFYTRGELVHVPEVISFLDKNPDVARINARCEQAQLH